MTVTAEAPPPTQSDVAVDMIDEFLNDIRRQTIVRQTDAVNFALEMRHYLTEHSDG